MTVLWEEDSKLTWVALNVGLCLYFVLGDVLLVVIFQFGKVAKRGIAVNLGSIERYLDVNHSAMSLHLSLFLRLGLRCSDVYKEVLVLDEVLTFLELVKVVVLDKLNHVSKQRIESYIKFQIL